MMMKNLLLLICGILISNFYHSQNRLTNAGFENWSGNYLTNWTGNNSAFAIDVNKINIAGTTGNYSAKLIMPNGVNRGSYLTQYFNLDNDDVERKYLVSFKMMYLSNPSNIALNVKITDSFGANINSAPHYPILNGQFVTNQWVSVQYEIMKPLNFVGTNSIIQIYLYSDLTNSTTERSVIIEDFSIIKIPSLSTNETNNTNKLYFANPVKNSLLINTTEKVEKIEIYTLSGQKIKTALSKNINVSDFPKGIYILKMEINNQIITKKFTKE